MKKILMFLGFLGLGVSSAHAVTISRSYNYFTVGGSTLSEIDKQLSARGPKLKSTGKRHPGATLLTFSTKVSYAQDGRYCRVSSATVSVKAKVTLPRWTRPKGASRSVRLIWDTLQSDIKRHEESHIIIAKNHARELEDALKNIHSMRNCFEASFQARKLSAKILGKHDREQAQFDRIESVNFESRMMRLLRYRVERMANGTQG